MAGDPRYAKGGSRRKLAIRVRAMGGECGICRGARGPIHYDEPSDHNHPLSFVLDEIHPVHLWQVYGYPSKNAAALDPSNVQAAHWICNAQKGGKDNWHLTEQAVQQQQPIVTSRRR